MYIQISFETGKHFTIRIFSSLTPLSNFLHKFAYLYIQVYTLHNAVGAVIISRNEKSEFYRRRTQFRMNNIPVKYFH